MKIAIGIVVLLAVSSLWAISGGIRSSRISANAPDLEVSTRTYTNTKFSPLLVTDHVVIWGDLRIVGIYDQ